MSYAESLDPNRAESDRDMSDRDMSGLEITPEKPHWVLKIWLLLSQRAQPALGWPAFFCVFALAWLPAQTARANDWLILDEFGSTIEPLGPLAVLLMWVILGWKRDRWDTIDPPMVTYPRWRVAGGILLLLLLGVIVLSHALVGWIPGPIQLIRTIINGSWDTLLLESTRDLVALGLRIGRWWNGVLAGGATQDDLVFAIFAGIIIWVGGLLMAWLARQTQQGLVTALPSLWLLLNALLYGSAGRSYFIGGLFLALLLQILLDQRRMVRRWERTGISFSDGLLGDRLLMAGMVAALVFGIAALMPNLSIDPVAERYYQLYQPFNAQVEGLGQRLFPDLKATSRFRGSSLADGMPNSFLLGAGPELSQHEVMRVRTDDIIVFEPAAMEEIPLIGHYMRGGTLSIYDGLGWQNPNKLEREEIGADSYVSSLRIQEPLTVVGENVELPRGRRLLTQDVFLAFTSRALYGAAEPISFSIDTRLEQRGAGDQVALWGYNANSLTSSYTVISAIPSVSSPALASEPFIDFDAESTWPELAPHLELPATITQRTRELAVKIVAEAATPFDAATAIETYLRTFEYDLTVAEPPDNIVDVADYFLFDLQRGYCDYYATAFVVLARLSGLPARFATGFAVGSWNSAEGIWIVTEAEAHSWPEVYFPSYGWIPFEPTAGRAQLQRIGVGLENNTPSTVVTTSAEPVETVETPKSTWSWQLLIWLLPVGGLLWLVYRGVLWWQIQYEDPWTVILAWGRRIGRPLGVGETMAEYGHQLSQFVISRYLNHQQDHGRIVARQLELMAQELTALRYGTPAKRDLIRKELEERWRSIRAYLRTLR